MDKKAIEKFEAQEYRQNLTKFISDLEDKEIIRLYKIVKEYDKIDNLLRTLKNL